MSAHSAHGSVCIDLEDRWDPMFEPRHRVLLENALPAYVAARRWYRTKTKRVQCARVLAAFPLSFIGARGGGAAQDTTPTARIVLVALDLEDGNRDTYVIPLAFVTEAELASLDADAKVIAARVVVRDDPAHVIAGAIVDALVIVPFLEALLDAIVRGSTIEDSGFSLGFHSLTSVHEPGATPEHLDTTFVRPRLLRAEQTNTSVLFGERFVGKVLRRIDPGESPDVEMGRFLTEARYEHAAVLAGVIDVHRDGVENAAPSTVGLLHVFVPSRGDAWKHATEQLAAWFGVVCRRGNVSTELTGDLLERAMSSESPDVSGAVGDYAALATLLGRRVGELHVALASGTGEPSFAVEPLDRERREMIANDVVRRLDRALDHLDGHGAELPEQTRRMVAELRSRRDALAARLVSAAGAAEGAVRTRVHGDLHLGQVLFTGDDFVLIDFEGEPSRSLEERRSKRSPFVDVAGMLRSFHYAVMSVLRMQPEASSRALASWGSLWHRTVTAAFLRGWLGAVERSVVLPPSPAVTRALLELLVMEKAVYELSYEMDNRPDWVDIPLEGLLDLFVTPETKRSR